MEITSKWVQSKYKSLDLWGPSHGRLWLLMESMPNFQRYTRNGNYLISESCGFVDVYEHRVGTRGGFADQEITLNVDGEKKTFRGDLWGPTPISGTSGNLQTFVSVYATDCAQRFNENRVYFPSLLKEGVFFRICESMGYPADAGSEEA